MSLRNSPKDIREGLDLVDSMSRDLRNVIENRQALERYLLTRDPNEIMLLSGAGLPII
jgi:anthranilate/para-aminobenzoate synthase component I